MWANIYIAGNVIQNTIGVSYWRHREDVYARLEVSKRFSKRATFDHCEFALRLATPSEIFQSNLIRKYAFRSCFKQKHSLATDYALIFSIETQRKESYAESIVHIAPTQKRHSGFGSRVEQNLKPKSRVL